MSANPFEPAFDAREALLDRLEPAWADAAHALRTGHRVIRRADGGRTIRTLSLLAVREVLNEYRRRIDAGNGLAVLAALRYCSQENVPAPYWLGEALAARMAKHESPDGPHSLDALFSDPELPAQGARARAARTLLAPTARLYQNVAARMTRGGSLDRALRDELKARRYPFGLTKARAAFEALADSQGRWLAAMGVPRRQRLSGNRPKPRKRVIRR